MAEREAARFRTLSPSHRTVVREHSGDAWESGRVDQARGRNEPMPGVEVELACGAADAPKEAPRFGRGHPKLSKYCYGDCQAERPKELFTQNEWDKCASKLRRCITCVAAKAKKVPDQSAAAAQQPPQQQPPQQAMPSDRPAPRAVEPSKCTGNAKSCTCDMHAAERLRNMNTSDARANFFTLGRRERSTVPAVATTAQSGMPPTAAQSATAQTAAAPMPAAPRAAQPAAAHAATVPDSAAPNPAAPTNAAPTLAAPTGTPTACAAPAAPARTAPADAPAEAGPRPATDGGMLAPDGAQQAGSPERRSARGGGTYGGAQVAARQEGAAAAREEASRATASEVASLKAQLRALTQERDVLRAADQAREAAAVAEQEQAAASSALSERVESALKEKTAQAIKDAAQHNGSHAVAPPLVAASITAAVRHARGLAVARRDGAWQPSKQPVHEITFPPPAHQVPVRDEYMAVGCRLKIVDWREVEPDISFSCGTCSAPMEVARHQPEPDGVWRDALSCTTTGKLGLTKEEGAAQPTLLSSVELRCTCKTCSHHTNMHSPEVLKQLPGNLVNMYSCDLPYATGSQLHFSRDLTVLAEALYTESATSVAGVVAAVDERLALGFENAMMQYHLARKRHLEAPRGRG